MSSIDDGQCVSVDDIIKRLNYWKVPENWQTELDDVMSCVDANDLVTDCFDMALSELEEVEEGIVEIIEDDEGLVNDIIKVATDIDNYGTNADVERFVEAVANSKTLEDMDNKTSDISI